MQMLMHMGHMGMDGRMNTFSKLNYQFWEPLSGRPGKHQTITVKDLIRI